MNKCELHDDYSHCATCCNEAFAEKEEELERKNVEIERLKDVMNETFEKLLASYRSAIVTHFKVQSDDDLDDKWNARVLELRAALTTYVAAKDAEIERLKHLLPNDLGEFVCDHIADVQRLEQENAALKDEIKALETHWENHSCD